MSILLVCAAVEWRWGVLLPARTVQWYSPCPAYLSAVLVSTAVVSCTVPCWVRGVWWCVCLCCSSYGVSSDHSPLMVVVGGAVVDGWVA
jgi:hypothetical protein